MYSIKFSPNLQKITKIIVSLLGITLIVLSGFYLNSSTYQSKTNVNKLSKDYDFYLQYNKSNKLSPSYFTSKVASGFEKIKIDVLPNHSDILLGDKKINAGDEINLNDLAKLIIKPNIDEYDNFKWSAIKGSNLLSTVVSKFGVGNAETVQLSRTILSNSSFGLSVEDFTAPFLAILTNQVFTQLEISFLPQNGILTLNGLPVNINQLIEITELGQLIYTPNTNYIGNDFYQVGFVTANGTFIGRVQIDINNRPPVTFPQSVNGVAGQTTNFSPFIATDEGATSFTISGLPAGFVCTDVNNVISCIIDSSVNQGSYSFNVTPVDDLGLAGSPVVYTINVAAVAPPPVQPSPSPINATGGTIVIIADVSSSNSLASSILSTSSISSISSSVSNSSSSSSNLQSTRSLVSLLSVNVLNSDFDTISTAKGVATVRTGGGY